MISATELLIAGHESYSRRKQEGAPHREHGDRRAASAKELRCSSTANSAQVRESHGGRVIVFARTSPTGERFDNPTGQSRDAPGLLAFGSVAHRVPPQAHAIQLATPTLKLESHVQFHLAFLVHEPRRYPT